MPAQLTLMRSGPSASAMSSAADTDSGSVTLACGEAGALAEFLDDLLTLEVDHHHRCTPVEQALGGGQAQA